MVVPLHCSVAGLTTAVGVGFGFTTTVILAEVELEQLVTVYVVVEPGEAFTVFPFVVFNPVDGLQTKAPSPPEATSEMEPPLQMLTEPPFVIVTLAH